MMLFGYSIRFEDDISPDVSKLRSLHRHRNANLPIIVWFLASRVYLAQSNFDTVPIELENFGLLEITRFKYERQSSTLRADGLLVDKTI